MALLPTDGQDYHLLAEAVERTRGLAGLSIEIGLREGGGTSVILEHSNPGSTHIAVDPYGDIDYHMSETCVQRGYYQNTMRDDTLSKVYQLAQKFGVNFLFFNMEDTEFFYRFRHSVPVYQDGRKILFGLYKLMHVDGQHSTSAVMRAMEFFVPRADTGAEIVFDDISAYRHDMVHRSITQTHGWIQVAESESRKVYRRGF